MAGEGIVGVLKAVLGLDTAQFEDGVKKATTELQGLQKTFLKIGATLGVGLSAAALVNSVKESINSLEELNKASQKVGVPVEELSALKFAAGLADVEMEALSSSLVKLAKNMAEVGKGSAGPAADAFKALGIEVQNSEGGLRSQIDVIGDLADKFQGFRDSAEKTALAVAIFGKAGAQMIPLLNQGRIGLEQNADEARRFGLIVSGELTASAELFNDNLKRLHGASEGLTLSFIQGLLPSLVKITEQMLDAREKGEGLAAVGEFIGLVFETISLGVRTLTTGLAVIINQFVGLAGAIVNIAKGNFPAAMKSMQEASEKNAKAIQDMGKAFDEHFKDDSLQKIYDETEAVLNLNRAYEGAPPAIIDATKSLENFIKSSAENVNQLRGQVATFGQSEGAVARFKFELQAMAKVMDEKGIVPESALLRIKGLGKDLEIITNQLVALGKEKAFKEQILSLGLQAREVAGDFAGKLAPGFLSAATSLKILKEDGSNLGAVLSLTDEKARKLNDAMFLLNAQRLGKEVTDPYTLFLQTMKDIEASFARLPGGTELAAKAVAKAAGEMATSFGNAASAIVSPMASAFKDLASMNKKYAGVAKAAAIAEALVNTYLGATKAFTATVQFGVPFAIAAAAAATVAGLANVAKISATQFATGGSFKVGGAGGIDSQLISMNLTPGEMVDVRKPGAQQPTSSREIVLTGMRPDEVFTGRWLRGFVDALNQGDRDGYKLRFAER